MALRVAQSADFQRANRLREFFLYVCEKSLTNRKNEIREQVIGVEVFGRPPDYNPAEDNVVRVEARDLRKRLDIYFLTQGRDEPLRIRIPKGSYVPYFEPNNYPAVAQVLPHTSNANAADASATGIVTSIGADGIANTSVKASPTKNKEGREASSPLLGDFFKPLGKVPLSTLVFAVLALALLGARLVVWGRGPAASKHSAATFQSGPSGVTGIWPTLFPGSRTLELVVADAGLPLIETAVDGTVGLPDYSNRKYVESLESSKLPPIMFFPYTSFGDVLSTLEIARTAEAQGKKILVRYPANLQLRDLANNDIIFLGSSYSDPWIQEFDAQRNFGVSVIDARKGRLCFSNKTPLNGEMKVYCGGPENDSTHETYGLVTFLPNLQNSGNVLILEGTDMEGTEGAADFVTHLHSGSDIRQYLMLRGRARLPYFQLLLKIGVVGDAPGQWEVIAHRVLSPSKF